ncbi:MAG: hypothetical protein VBE63_22295 [Lamprobacter sp.]|uniref:hypothetical protein n=1 Tax=Lamprobacter sp. TaxID=3100796 RepID=UPI002B25A9D1|nr:hypothetical protein [Lamprobacter sp.]MEA3642648.1 hypothetical protein [Lamprobacter sp.]
MGLFSTKKTHFVDTSIVRVVEDELASNALRAATVESAVKYTRVTETVRHQALRGNFRLRI